MDSAKSGLTKILGKRIIGLSELAGSMGELAEFLKAASSMLHKVLTELGLVLLLESVELALVTIEVIVVTLLGKMSQHLRWWVVKVARPAILVALVVSSFTFLVSISRLGLLVKVEVHALSLDWRGSIGIIMALLALKIDILDRRGCFVDLLTERASSGGRLLYLIDDNLLLFLVHHLNKFVK